MSIETIYKYIVEDKASGGNLYNYLLVNSRRRYRKRVKAGRVGKTLNRVVLEKRPKVAENRKRYGDREVDLIEGSKGSDFLLSLYERKSRLGKLFHLETKEDQGTADVIITVLSSYKVHTLTYDNGLEFAWHEQVVTILSAKSYFCAPYHSWEKGGVENFNGLVRQYCAKGSSFDYITQEDLLKVEQEINEQPKKNIQLPITI